MKKPGQRIDVYKRQGKYNCVLTGAVEFGDSTPSPADNVESPKHPYKRDKMTMEKFLKTTSWLYDRTYTRSLMAGQELIYDDAAEWYVPVSYTPLPRERRPLLSEEARRA